MVSGQLGVGRGSPSWPLWPYDSDILKCPGTIVSPHWSVIFAIKWRYEGSSWRAANLFPIIIVTNVTESTSNIFFYLLIRYFLSLVTIDRGKDPKRAGSTVMFCLISPESLRCLISTNHWHRVPNHLPVSLQSKVLARFWLTTCLSVCISD